MHVRRGVVVGSVVVALLATSCGKLVEKATEAAIEKGADAADVDISKDGLKVETKDGKFESGPTTEIPKDLPKAPMFDDASLQASTRMSGTTKTTWLLSGTVKDPKAAYQNLLKALKADGWEVGTEMESATPQYSGIGMASKGGLELNFGTSGKKEFHYWLSQAK